MAYYNTTYVIMKKVFKLWRKKSKSHEARDESVHSPSTSSPSITDVEAQLTGQPISKQNIVYTEEENIVYTEEENIVYTGEENTTDLPALQEEEECRSHSSNTKGEEQEITSDGVQVDEEYSIQDTPQPRDDNSDTEDDQSYLNSGTEELGETICSENNEDVVSVSNVFAEANEIVSQISSISEITSRDMQEDVCIEHHMISVLEDLGSPISKISLSSGVNSMDTNKGYGDGSLPELHSIEINTEIKTEQSYAEEECRHSDGSNLHENTHTNRREVGDYGDVDILSTDDEGNVATNEYACAKFPTDILENFKLFDDSNGNSYVTLDDVKSASASFGIVIYNNDCRRLMSTFSKHELHLIFDLMDEQKQGYITAHDIIREMKKLGHFLTRPDPADISSNKNIYSRINFSQFVKFCKEIDRCTNIPDVVENDFDEHTKWTELNHISLNDYG